jgi:hypothetical protein
MVFLLHKFAGVQDAARIEGVLDLTMEFPHFGGNSERPPGLFGKADAVLAGDDAIPGEHLLEEVIQGGLRALEGIGLGHVHHHVGVDVAVAGVAEAGKT